MNNRIDGHTLPSVVNLHFWKLCNERCGYCFATFHDDAVLAAIKRGLSEEECRDILSLLAAAGVRRVNFAGDEPTLAPHLPRLIIHAKSLGLQVSIISNGVKLETVLHDAAYNVDLVGLSLDSGNEKTQQGLGRGNGNYVARTLRLFSIFHDKGIATKLNTVVTTLNVEEDLGDTLRTARPARWKVLQVLAVGGQNDGRVEPLLVSRDAFKAYVARHAQVVADLGILLADETNEEMTASYAIIDPAGRFFSNAFGHHTYSRPILEVGVVDAFQQVTFLNGRFLGRGGDYNIGDLVQLGRPSTRRRS